MQWLCCSSVFFHGQDEFEGIEGGEAEAEKSDFRNMILPLVMDMALMTRIDVNSYLALIHKCRESVLLEAALVPSVMIRKVLESPSPTFASWKGTIGLANAYVHPI